jgi:hypothetical protein
MARPRKNPRQTIPASAPKVAGDEVTPANPTDEPPANDGSAPDSADAPKAVVPEITEAPKPAAEPEPAPRAVAKAKTIRMTRDESHPAPHSADVHPNEVDEWKLRDWVEA